MLRKILATMTALLILSACASVKQTDSPPDKPRPAVIQYYDAKFAENGIAAIYDWEMDKEVLFLWIDKLDTERTCDHVAILGIVDINSRPPKFHSIYIINDQNVRNGLTPCEAGRMAWLEYVKVKAAQKAQKPKKDKSGGI